MNVASIDRRPSAVQSLLSNPCCPSCSVRPETLQIDLRAIARGTFPGAQIPSVKGLFHKCFGLRTTDHTRHFIACPTPATGQGNGSGRATVWRLATATLIDLNIKVLFLFGANDVAIGTVKWFNPTKGYGFIAPEDGGNDVFVHISAVEKAGYTSLAEGAKVSYELMTNRSGKQAAENLRLG